MDWGWTSYEKTSWVKDYDCKLYIGHFRTTDDPDNFTKVTIRFWARRPILALRKIVESGKVPLTFAEKTIN